MATINGQYVLVEEETPTYEVDIPTQPVEEGINLTDHVQRKASTLSISGFIVGDNAAQIRDNLRRAMRTGTIVKFIGRNSFVGLISGFSTGHNYTVANGFSFSMTLKEIRTAKTSYVDKLPLTIKSQAAPIVNSGTKQTKSKSTKKTTAKKDDTVQKVKFKAGSQWEEE